MKALSQPLFASLRGYDRAQLGPDLFSGALIALLSIPISMGYAQLAGLPPVYGLYGSLVPILLFAMLSTTREFIFGRRRRAGRHDRRGWSRRSGVAPGGAEAMRVVPVLTLYVALWLSVFALVRADKAVDYISEPVMGGFISGVCCEIILMQVPKIARLRHRHGASSSSCWGTFLTRQRSSTGPPPRSASGRSQFCSSRRASGRRCRGCS